MAFCTVETLRHFTTSRLSRYNQSICIMARTSLICLFLICTLSMACAQPFTVNTPQFEPGILEPQQRLDINYTGFVFDFNNKPGTIVTQSPGGMQQGSVVSNNPFVSTLPGDGNSVVLITLGPCAANTPHIHPRGSEISTVISGPSFQFGLVEEDQANNTLILRTLSPLQTIHIPQGVMHFAYNPTCETVKFVANFATTDPGIQTFYNSLTSVPNDVLHASTGIPQANWATLKKQYPLVTTPGTGGDACMAKCGLNFLSANTLTPVANPN